MKNIIMFSLVGCIIFCTSTNAMQQQQHAIQESQMRYNNESPSILFKDLQMLADAASQKMKNPNTIIIWWMQNQEHKKIAQTSDKNKHIVETIKK